MSPHVKFNLHINLIFDRISILLYFKKVYKQNSQEQFFKEHIIRLQKSLNFYNDEVFMKMTKLEELLKENEYPGRGIVAGLSPDGKHAVSAYWTMGRSAGSRNRIFTVEEENGSEVVRTKAFDPSLIAGDPSLIIYAAVRQFKNSTIVTNGDQTDTIFDGLKAGKSFEESLRSRKYEHDSPNYTPRISSLLNVENGKFNFAISILKSDNGNAENTLRFTYTYDNPQKGQGRFIHTYLGNGNPLPSFEGEPRLVEISGAIGEFTDKIWESLNEENKVSLFVRYIDIETGKFEERIVNKNK